jgi:UDP-N-acetylbacillosamine N-acetyltransferase
MFIKNNKPVKIIGFPESSITQQYFEVFNKEGLKDISIITPKDFKALISKDNYQYIIAFYLDMDLRKEVCDLLDNLNLDCLTYIDDSVYMFSSSKIGRGSFIGHLCEICWNASVGDHCYFDNQSGIGHDVILGRNSIISSRVYVGGRTKIGENCKFFLNGTVMNNLNICDNVILCTHSNITKDITIPGKYVGRNARLMKSEESDKDL